METIILKPIVHRQQECIGIYFSNEPVLNKAAKNINGSRWTKTHRCWYTLLNRANYQTITTAFEGLGLTDNTALKTYLAEKKKNASTVAMVREQTDAVKANKTFSRQNTQTAKPTAIKNTPEIQQVNLQVMATMRQQLILKAYSPSTIKTYLNEMSQLLQTIGNTSADSLTPEHLKRYFIYCLEKLKLTENTLHSRINALKFYYEQVLGREKFFWEIPRPKKHEQLPKVLGENEIGRMFNALANIKHKAILFTAYSAGLRVSEVVNLKIKDVDSERMQLFIEKAKGKKDRYVGLGILLLDVLRAYIKNCHPFPKIYVFENPQRPGTSYSCRSAQQIFQTAKEKAMINKEVGIHSLRHSFATHLLEKGIDIRYIKDLLGHLNIKTTEKYLHVKKETLINIPNVLDELNKSIRLNW